MNTTPTTGRREGRKPRGVTRKWSPDQDSLDLLDLYEQRRLQSWNAPMETTVDTEKDYLRGLMHASVELGGPHVLRGLVHDPDMVVRIVRTWPRTRRTKIGMLTAVMRLIEIAVEDASYAALLRERIQAGLYPRPLDRRAWNHTPRMVAGPTRIQRRRPILQLADLRKIVENAAEATSDPNSDVRDRALCAIYLFSGVSPGELHGLGWDQLEWIEPEADYPWCAVIHGIRRRGRRVCIPIEKEALAYLNAHREGTTSLSGPIFLSPRLRRKAIGDSMAKTIIKRATRLAGLPACDNVTFKRAYAAFLAAMGLADHEIRDALGLRLMATVDHVRGPHKRRAAQRLLAEHAVIIEHGPAVEVQGPLSQPRLGLFNDDGA